MDKNVVSDAKVDEMAKSTFVDMCKERSKYEVKSEEKTKHDSNIAELYSSIKKAQNNEAEVEISNQQLEFDKERFNKESEQRDAELDFNETKFYSEYGQKDNELETQRYIADKEAEVKHEQIEAEQKTSKLKMVGYIFVALCGVALHGLDIQAEKEGYMTDEKVSSFDKHSKGPLSWFGK